MVIFRGSLIIVSSFFLFFCFHINSMIINIKVFITIFFSKASNLGSKSLSTSEYFNLEVLTEFSVLLSLF